MVEQEIAFWLSRCPQEIALRSCPGRAAVDAGRPDRSLTVGPSVVRGAADGAPALQKIVEAWAASNPRHENEAGGPTGVSEAEQKRTPGEATVTYFE